MGRYFLILFFFHSFIHSFIQSIQSSLAEASLIADAHVLSLDGPP
jgi:hypothetical protein